MFREMRRGRQALPKEMCEAVLSRGSHGVLALAGDEGYLRGAHQLRLRGREALLSLR